MRGQNNYSSPSRSSSFPSQPYRVDLHEHKENVTEDGAAFSFVFRDELGTSVDPSWDVNLGPAHSYPTIEEAERELEKAIKSMGNRSPFTDITNSAQHAEPSELQEAIGPNEVSTHLIEDPIPLVMRTRNSASVDEIKNVSCTNQAVSAKGDEKEGIIANETGGSEPNDAESLSPEETQSTTPSTSATPTPTKIRNTVLDEKDQEYAQLGTEDADVCDKGKRRAFRDDENKPGAPRKRKRAEHHQEDCTSEQASELQYVLKRKEGGQVTSHEGKNERTRDRLADNFISWRFGFKYVHDATVRWSCPFSVEYALEDQMCQVQFDANAIEKHISEHIKSFEEKHKGEPLGCPLGGQDDCQWDNKDRTENTAGPNSGLSRHIRQVHLGTRRVECLCGSILSRDTRQELVRHLRLAFHNDDLDRKRASDPSIPFYPAVNDPSVVEEEHEWKKLHSATRRATRPHDDDKGEGSSKGVKCKRPE